MNKRRTLDYAKDLIYGAAQFPCGWVRPRVVKGDFHANRHTELQQLFFSELLRIGFHRTYWQLVYPGQIAGLIREVSKDSLRSSSNGTEEKWLQSVFRSSSAMEEHIRMYPDKITCEVEHGGFSRLHWMRNPKKGVDSLVRILDDEVSTLSSLTKNQIRILFKEEEYAKFCVRDI